MTGRSLVYWLVLGISQLSFVFLNISKVRGACYKGRILKQRIVWVGCAYAFFFGGCFFTLVYYLPIYFQAVKGTSAAQSGVRNLPLIITAAIVSIVSGGTLSKTDKAYFPFLVIGGIAGTLGAGLMYSLNINSPPKNWAGCEAITGICLGLAFQLPMIGAQASVKMSDIFSVSSMLLFFQLIGGSFWVSAAQSAFSNRLLLSVPHTAPGVDPEEVLAAGAANLRKAFTPEQLPGVVWAHMRGLRLGYGLAIVVRSGFGDRAFCATWRFSEAGR